jgi:hypothetical protein
MPAAIFGITNDALNTVVGLLVVFLIAVYVALVVWTYLDARRRINDQFLVGCAAVGALFLPFAGALVYSILRPPEFLDDARERELEIRSAELRVRQLEEASCPNCSYPIERTYLRCPSCRARVKNPCEACGKPVDPRWSLCPYCEAPTRAAQAAARQRRPAKRPAGAPARRRKPTEEAPAARRKAAGGETRKPRTAAAKSRPAAKPAPRQAPAEGGEERPKPAAT